MPRAEHNFVAPSISFPPGRDASLGSTVQEQESDFYIARHNSLIDALGSELDGAFADASFPLTRLEKGVRFEVVRTFHYPFRALAHVARGIL